MNIADDTFSVLIFSELYKKYLSMLKYFIHSSYSNQFDVLIGTGNMYCGYEMHFDADKQLQ